MGDVERKLHWRGVVKHQPSSGQTITQFCCLNSFAQAVRDQLGGDRLSGSWCTFRGKGRDRLKILYQDRDGYAIWQKRHYTGIF